MKLLEKNREPKVTLHTTGSKDKRIIKDVHGRFYIKKNGNLYGRNDGNGYRTAKIAERYL